MCGGDTVRADAVDVHLAGYLPAQAEAERDQGRLGGGVHREAGDRAVPRQRSDVDQVAALTTEGVESRSRAPDRAEQVHGDQAAHLVLAELDDPAVEPHAGVVDPHRQPAVALRLGRGLAVSFGLAYVVREPGNGTDLLGRTTDRVAVHVGEHHLVTEPHQLDPDGPPDPAGGTGHNRRSGAGDGRRVKESRIMGRIKPTTTRGSNMCLK